MKILVTGGAGYVGSHLVPRLEEQGHEVHVFDRLRLSRPRYIRGDICDYGCLEAAFDAVRPELVFHLAGMVSRRECEETPTLAIQTNAEGTLNVCALSLKHGSRVIYAGSSEEYGTRFSETFYNYGEKHRPVGEDTPFGEPTSVYALTKRMAEEIVQHFAAFRGLTATTMRLFMLYGPGEEPSDYRSAVARFTDWALRGLPLTVHRGTERSWCYIDDAVEAMTLIAERRQPTPYEAFNIGREDPTPTETLAEKIVEACGSSSEIVLTEPEATVIPVKRASFRKAKTLLGWEATTPLDEGLRETVEWMRRNLRGSSAPP